MKVIILDDSRTDAYLATQVAKKYFSVVEVVGTPGEFRAALRAEPKTNFCIVDIHLGDLHSGISEMASMRELNTSFSSIPVVVVTASTDASLHAFALSNGADAVIVKPISAEKLEPILRALIPGAISVGV